MKKQSLSADYLRDFACIGSACEDTCCAGWGVMIDKGTFAKYKKLPDKKWKRALTQHIRRNKYETTFSSYALIKMNEHGYCPFLNQERLCSIQLSLGSGYLSKTCASYPRQLNKVYEHYESSAVLSCPEVARLTLQRPEGLTYSAAPLEVEKNALIDKLVEEEGFQQTFAPLRGFIIDLLRNRSIDFGSRLLLLGSFIQELEGVLAEDGDEPILRTIARWQGIVAGEDWQSRIAGLRVDPQEQFQLLLSIVKDYLDHTEATSRRYLDLFHEWAEGTGYAPANYAIALSDYYAPFMHEHDYLLENYTVHYVFTQLFPFSLLGESLYADYVVLILHVALLRFHLIGLAAYHQGLTVELVTTMVYLFARTYEHDTTFFKNVLKHLCAKKRDTLDDMSLLIR